MKIAVTGATGFIGRHVVSFLVNNTDHEVIALSRVVEKARDLPWFGAVNYVEADISDAGKHWMDALQGPDIVIHLAWSGLPDYYNWHHFSENLPVSFKFLHNLAESGLKNLTVAGTCLEYGFREGCLTEDMPAEPANPYALAKDSLRKAVEQMARQFGFNYKWLRLFYTYGEGQNPHAIIPQLEAAINGGEHTFNMSGGEQVRDYLPVNQLAANICMVALQDEINGIINCCSGKGTTVKDLVEDHLRRNNIDMQLNLGYYPYTEHEPFQFWGNDTKQAEAIASYCRNK